MSRIACKFGGSSLADASQFKKVKAIVEADPKRSIVVPSAPGKRSSSDAKLTDLLYLCQSSAALGTHFTEPFGLIRERFLEIERDLGLDAGMQGHLDKLEAELTRGVTKDYVASTPIEGAKYLIGEKPAEEKAMPIVPDPHQNEAPAAEEKKEGAEAKTEEKPPEAAPAEEKPAEEAKK